MSRGPLAITARFRAVPVLAQDAFIYLCSAVFAGVTAIVAAAADYRQWGEMAVGAYAGVGLVVGGFYCYGRRHPLPARVISWVRRLAVVTLLIVAVLLPLATQITWRADNRPGEHAQTEVAVIERAGDRVAHDKHAYLVSPTGAGVSPRNDAKTVDESSVFPYLPGMILFGLPNALRAPLELTDARVELSGFTLLVVGLVLALGSVSLARRGRALQWLIVLPSGALPMVTGGDDLPVLALMLAGLVALNRRRPLVAGLLLGLAGTLKFTAWPLLLLCALVASDTRGERARVRYLGAAAVVVVPALVLGVASGPIAFFDNVIGFPLGLSKLHSPAASPLLGELLTYLFPEARRVITLVLVVVGVVILTAVYRYQRPRTPGAIARFTGFAMFLATVLAPATRFGYLIYPVNLFVWSYMLDAMAPRRAQDSSSTSSSRTTNLLVGTGLSPASAALIEPST